MDANPKPKTKQSVRSELPAHERRAADKRKERETPRAPKTLVPARHKR